MATRNFTGIFGFPTLLQTKSIFKNNVNIVSATIYAQGDNLRNIQFYLTNQGNLDNPTWEVCSLALEHYFSMVGQDLRLRAIGKKGSIITLLKVIYITE